MTFGGSSNIGKLHDDEIVRVFVQTGYGRYFEELFHRHGRKVFLACLAFHHNTEAAEDTVQETFLRAYQNLSNFSGGDLVAWLLRIARNCCIDRWRRNRPEVSYEALSPGITEPTHEVLGSTTHLALLQLEQEMAALPKHQKACLELKAEGLSYEETAAKIGASVDDVRSYLQNGRRTLRLRMAEVLSELL